MLFSQRSQRRVLLESMTSGCIVPNIPVILSQVPLWEAGAHLYPLSHTLCCSKPQLHLLFHLCLSPETLRDKKLHSPWGCFLRIILLSCIDRVFENICRHRIKYQWRGRDQRDASHWERKAWERRGRVINMSGGVILQTRQASSSSVDEEEK